MVILLLIISQSVLASSP